MIRRVVVAPTRCWCVVHLEANRSLGDVERLGEMRAEPHGGEILSRNHWRQVYRDSNALCARRTGDKPLEARQCLHECHTGRVQHVHRDHRGLVRRARLHGDVELERQARLMACVNSADYREATQSFMEKRAPVFTGS